MSDYQTILDKVTGLVKDIDGKLDPADLDNGIAGALTRYSSHRPKLAFADIEGDGTHLYAAPAGWVNEFSEIDAIEFPVDLNPESLMDRDDDYAVYETAAAEKIRLVKNAPEAGEFFRVRFTVPRTEATIAVNDIDAVANLAASICLGMLASRYISSKKPAIQADSVNYQSKSSECTARGKVCLAFYNDHLGIKTEGGAPAAAVTSSSESSYPGGMDRLTHTRWSRNKRWQ